MTKETAVKFGFLAVLIGVVLFSRIAYPAASPTTTVTSSVETGIAKQNLPLFTIPQTSVSAGNTAVASTSPAAAATPPASASTPATPYIVSGASVFTQVGDVQPPAPNVTGFLVADLTTGTPFASLNPDKRWPTASITKLMTATVVFDNMDLTQKITITPAEFAVDPADETNLVVGGTYTVDDLLHDMLLPSSNVAAEALADTYGHDAFMAKMNANAAAWGMTNTFYNDPSGLSAANESTADDFLKLAQKVYTDYPQILAITDTPKYTITNYTNNSEVTIESINDFAGAPDFIGGKTGHTSQADGNLLSLFRYDGNPLFIVVLGTNNRFIDTEDLYTWFKANFK